MSRVGISVAETGTLPRWVSGARQMNNISLIAFLRRCNANARVYMEHGARSVAFAGCGTVHTVSATGPHRFNEIQQQLKSLSAAVEYDQTTAPAEALPRWFGGFSFRSGHQPEGVWSAFPAAQFVLPRRQLTRANGKTWLTVNEPLRPGESAEAARRRMQSTLDHESEHLFTIEPQPVCPNCLSQLENLMDEDTWRQRVEATTNRIIKGELEKVVLAQACRAQAQAEVDPLDVLEALKPDYGNCYRFLMEPRRSHAFFGATPELLAQVQRRTVETVAMAGSIGRGKTAQQDASLGEGLLSNAKERHEHQVVVDAIRRNLAPLTDSLDISDEPGIETFSNIQHLSTEIRGTLADNCGILPVVEALHPTPAMGGAPRDVALSLIDAEEPFSRGWYASPVGWVDVQGNGLFAVAIRSAVSVGRKVQLFAGAGIVRDSDPQREWDEVQLKFQPILNALR